jgi:hypothetical protein
MTRKRQSGDEGYILPKDAERWAHEVAKRVLNTPRKRQLHRILKTS